MTVYQEIHKAKTAVGKRAQPPENTTVGIDMKSWLTEEDQKQESYVYNISWTLARQDSENGQQIPLWGAYNETCCTVKH